MKRFGYKLALLSTFHDVLIHHPNPHLRMSETLMLFSPECDLNIVLFPSDGFCFSVFDLEHKEQTIKEKHPDNRRSVSVSFLMY